MRRLKDAEVAAPEKGILLFSQIRTHKRDLLWGFEVGKPGDRTRYLTGREVRFPNGFYDIGCGRVGSVTAIALSPGTYEFGPWKIDGAMMLIGPAWVIGKTHKGGKGRFTVEIKQGEVTYVGEISIDETNNNTATVNDNFTCEKEYLQRTWPWLTSLPKANAVSIPSP